MDWSKCFDVSHKYYKCYVEVCKLFSKFDELEESKEKDASKYNRVALDILLKIEEANTIMRIYGAEVDISYWGYLERVVYEDYKHDTSIGNVSYRDWFKASEYYEKDRYSHDYDAVTIFYAVKWKMLEVLNVPRS